LNIYLTATGDRSFTVEDIVLGAGTPFNLTAGAQAAAAGAGGSLQSSRSMTGSRRRLRRRGGPSASGPVQGFPADEFLIVGKTGLFIKGLFVKTPSYGFLVFVGGKENPPLGYDKFTSSFQITKSG
jgi:hypothetical protein